MMLEDLDQTFCSSLQALLDGIERLKVKYPGSRYSVMARTRTELAIVFWPPGATMMAAIGMKWEDSEDKSIVRARPALVLREVDEFTERFLAGQEPQPDVDQQQHDRDQQQLLNSV